MIRELVLPFAAWALRWRLRGTETWTFHVWVDFWGRRHCEWERVR